MRATVTEADVQRAILDLLRTSGFTAWSTSRVRRRCVCGRFAGGGDGVDRGLPDVVFAHPAFPGLLGGIEVKGPRTRVSAAQRQAAEIGHYPICRSVEDAATWVASWWCRQAAGNECTVVGRTVPGPIAALAGGGK
ncbi:MAG: hypothetical protein KIS66_13705 [Fimbriimonadaceae bacterium]|nr:hypothetical protein [Fimbriimonadaceae bacterium]